MLSWRHEDDVLATTTGDELRAMWDHRYMARMAEHVRDCDGCCGHDSADGYRCPGPACTSEIHDLDALIAELDAWQLVDVLERLASYPAVRGLLREQLAEVTAQAAIRADELAAGHPPFGPRGQLGRPQ